ncbi:MAG: alpha-glucan family phosphorylase [bacterium]
MKTAERLRELARNLYWTWHPAIVEIFRDLDVALWRRVNHNPVAFLARLAESQPEKLSAEPALEARITQAFHRLRQYLDARGSWGVRYASILRAAPVAYFSAEFGLHESIPIYSGGLGVLAGDHLKSASDLGVPLVGVGLFYAKGYFDQALDRDGWQQESYFAADVHSLPLEPARDEDGKPLRVKLKTRSGELHAEIWAAHVGRSRLILLDTNVAENDEKDRALTAQLYGGDVRTRIRQELVLGVGGMRALEAMDIRPGVIHLNEGHSAFAVLELARAMMQREGRPFAEVQERAAARTVFTTHTPVEAGHDRFDAGLVEEALGPLRDELGLSKRDFVGLGRVAPDDPNEPFCMTVLGLRMSRSRNAVSAIHGQVSRRMWRGLWPGLDTERVPIGHITNGAHTATWVAAPMANLYRRYVDGQWQTRACGPETWAAVSRINEEEFWEQHQILKTGLVEFARRRLRDQAEGRGEEPPQMRGAAAPLDPVALTIGFARRFATYKRATLLLSDPDRLGALVNHPQRPVQVVYAGKAHPNDEEGKRVVQQVFRFTREERFAGKIVFIENHDINVSRHLAQGVDVWLNNPRRPLEACGTSGQKVILNGGLNLSTLDGWWAQAYDGANGFAIGEGTEHASPERQDDMDAQALFDVLEKQVVPTFYRRDAEGVPRAWVARQKEAIRTLAWRFCARRMVMDYTLNCYLPAAGADTSSLSPRSLPGR